MELEKEDNKIKYNIAGRRKRLYAQILDTFIALIFVFMPILFIFLIPGSEVSASVSFVFLVLGISYAVYYTFFADGFKNGQSFGKKIVKISVIQRKNGDSCGPLKSFIRNFSLYLLGPIDWLFIFGDEKRRLGDHIADTIVIVKND